MSILGLFRMKHDALEAFDQPRRVGFDTVAQGDPAEALQQLLPRLRKDEIDEKLGSIRMRRLGAQHDAVEFDNHRFQVDPVDRRSLRLGPFNGVCVGNCERKLSYG